MVVADPVVAQAISDAEAAAQAARVRVRPAESLAELAVVRQVLDEVWSADPTNPTVTVELLKAYAHTGQYVVLAEDLSPSGAATSFPDSVIAASVAFLAAPIGRALHSNLTGVLPPGAGRPIGFAVKAHQRAWALQRGLDIVSWTFDPLIRRNQWFNLGKLAATPVQYLENFYGSMADAINAGDESDRLYLRWFLREDAVAAAAAGRPRVVDVPAIVASGQAVTLLSVGRDGGPLVHAGDAGAPRWRLAQVPPDIEGLRRADPAAALAWRRALREALHGSLSQGWSVCGVDRQGWYVLERSAATKEEP